MHSETNQPYPLKKIIISLLCLCSVFGALHAQKIEDALAQVERALRTHRQVVQSRIDHIDSIRVLLAKDSSYTRLSEIATAYKGLDNDSAMHYSYRAMQTAFDEGKTEGAQLSILDLASCLGKTSMFADAQTAIDYCDPTILDRKGRLKYYDIKSQLYVDKYSFQKLRFQKESARKAALENLDSLKSILPADTEGYRMVQAQIYTLMGDTVMAIGELNEITDKIDEGHPLSAVTHGMLANLYEDSPQYRDEYIYHLALSATADLLAGNREEASLIKLGTALFEHGDTHRAYEFLLMGGEDIYESGSKNLYDQLVPSLSDVIHTMQAHDHRRDVFDAIFYSFLLLTILFFVIRIYFYRRNIRAGRKEKERLSGVIASRDVYINQLLELCSVYVEGMEEYNRLVSRKIKANQVQDLYSTIESGKLVQAQSARFFDVFDSAILKIYPNFIEIINSLLQPDKQVQLTPDHKLTPELRITAFLCLGINDSTQLSKFLVLSLNTVYTYRNRMKSRAVSRETFEQNLLKLIGKAI